MDNPCHVRLREFHPPHYFVLVGHSLTVMNHERTAFWLTELQPSYSRRRLFPFPRGHKPSHDPAKSAQMATLTSSSHPFQIRSFSMAPGPGRDTSRRQRRIRLDRRNKKVS